VDRLIVEGSLDRPL